MMTKQEIEWEIDEDEDESQNHAGSTIMTSFTVSRKPASSSCTRSATSVSVKWEDRQGGEEKKPHNEKYQQMKNRKDFLYLFGLMCGDR